MIRAGVAGAMLLGALFANLPAQARGAVERGHYRNLFGEAGHSRGAVDAKLAAYWQALFEGDAEQRIAYAAPPTAGGPSGYILDVAHGDIRSEGMSYGMMIAVQTGHKAMFDSLWNWAHTHMRYASGPRAGYFRWRCTPAGCGEDAAPASDGEQYFATALFFASHRWGNGRGVYAYENQANAILDTMLHKQDMNGGVVAGTTAMFDRATRQVVFVPLGDGARFTDPSYHLPAFYELWARWARGWHGRRADRAFWRQAAQASRALFARAADSRTALTPDYAGFDGTPRDIDGHGAFGADAYRSAINWAVDCSWWGCDRRAIERTDRLLAFFEQAGTTRYGGTYRIDGTALSSLRSPALIATNGAAALATSSARARPFVAALWALEPPRGRWRYYDGLIQFLAMLHASGRFRAW